MKSNPTKANPGETELWNCENAFEFVCPLKWESLGQTEAPGIRFCGVCNQNVYLCESPLEFASQGNLGRCVAIPAEVTPTRALPHHIIGRMTSAGVKQMQLRDEREREWWKSVLANNPTFNTEEIDEIRRAYNLET